MTVFSRVRFYLLEAVSPRSTSRSFTCTSHTSWPCSVRGSGEEYEVSMAHIDKFVKEMQPCACGGRSHRGLRAPPVQFSQPAREGGREGLRPPATPARGSPHSSAISPERVLPAIQPFQNGMFQRWQKSNLLHEIIMGTAQSLKTLMDQFEEGSELSKVAEALHIVILLLGDRLSAAVPIEHRVSPKI
ncbi:uncharacterized protein LOC143667177 isoform X6 [Tamandua tetradactyla]